MSDSSRNSQPLVSLIIDNYNYGRYLPFALDSALSQTYRNVEVLVVDDGSTDNSRDILADYGDRIRTVLKSNGGQASALNAGFRASRGEWVVFLDSDDILYPFAVANAVARSNSGPMTKVQWPLDIINGSGTRTGETRPPQVPPEGDFRDQVLERGPSNVASSPTSGNAWSRSFLNRILPIPEDIAYYRSCADEFLYTLAPIFGRVRTIAEPQGSYRVHGENVYSSRSFRQKMQMEIAGYDEQCAALSRVLSRNGIAVNVEGWKKHSWFHRLSSAVDAISRAVPAKNDFVLVDGCTWGLLGEFEERRVRSFIDADGDDGGPPVNDEAAIDRLKALSKERVRYLVIAWPCFWWFEQYPRLFRELEVSATCLLKNDVVAIFQL